jgi:hypothetical protein
LRKVLHTSSAISQALDDIPSGSDISDIESDSGDDETYKPKAAEDDSSSDDSEPDENDKGHQGEIGGVGDDRDDEILPDVDVGEPLVCAAGPAIDTAAAEYLGLQPKRRRTARE